MAKTKNPELLRRKEKVRAATDLVGVPEGTMGRVVVSNGLQWIRYWVAFENGREVGSINRTDLVRAKEWDQFLIDREAAEAAGPIGTDDAAAIVGGAETATGGGASVNGVEVPQLLLDRTTSALERFGVTR